jgi:hypothetical protein
LGILQKRQGMKILIAFGFVTADLRCCTSTQRRSLLHPLEGQQLSSGPATSELQASIFTLFAGFGNVALDDAGLVAPQGFTDVANKRDTNVFHIIPHAIPHTRNKDLNSDLRTTL